MKNKVILILVDGMRPDGMLKCNNPFVEKLISNSEYTLNAKTVMPSMTLPCHFSLFHSVKPERHGITTNLYTPQVRPVEGLVDRLSGYGKKCAFFYTWEELRDLCRPGKLNHSILLNILDYENVDCDITEKAISYIRDENPDFTFLYLGQTDEIGGHRFGWMTQEYLHYINNAFSCIEKVFNSVDDSYNIIVMADHGGHDRTHGENIKEDMTIPVLLSGPLFEKGKELNDVSILDVAPTVAAILNTPCPDEWEGKSLLKEIYNA